MSRRRKTALAVLGAAALLLGLILWPSSEPRYEGLTLNQSLDILAGTPFTDLYEVDWRLKENDPRHTESAKTAFLLAGTNATSFLVSVVLDRSEGSGREQWWVKTWPKLPQFLQKHIRKPVTQQERRNAAGYALELLVRPSADDLLPLIQGALASRDPRLRLVACHLLGVAGSRQERVVPHLIRAFEDTDPKVREAATYAVGRVGPAAAEAVPLMLSSNNLSSPVLRQLALQSLEKSGADPAVAGPYLKAQRSNETNAHRRQLLARVLCRIDGSQTNVLNELIVTSRTNVGTLFDLGLIGSNAAPAVPMLMNMLESTNQAKARAAAWVLGQIGAERDRVVNRLWQLYETQDDHDQLGTLHNILILLDPGHADAMSKLIATFKRFSADGKDTELIWAMNVFRSMGPAAKAAIPELERAMASEEPAVRRAAIEALKAIDPARLEEIARR